MKLIMENWRKYCLMESEFKLPPLNVNFTNDIKDISPKLENILNHPKIGQVIANNISKFVDLRKMRPGKEKLKQFIPNEISITDLLDGFDIPTEFSNYKLDTSLAFADITKPFDPNNPPTLNIGLSGKF